MCQMLAELQSSHMLKSFSFFWRTLVKYFRLRKLNTCKIFCKCQKQVKRAWALVSPNSFEAKYRLEFNNERLGPVRLRKLNKCKVLSKLSVRQLRSWQKSKRGGEAGRTSDQAFWMLWLSSRLLKPRELNLQAVRMIRLLFPSIIWRKTVCLPHL